jgi:alanyl-tRNA synthetase
MASEHSTSPPASTGPRRMGGDETRSAFLDFFAARGHQRVRSSPVVLAADPTLLFVNAGMVQFKDVFTGAERRETSRATTVQKVIRAGGKHNDIDEVGRTPRHHTFFEMLGNFSFGDYFKQEAIQLAWDLLVHEWQLPVERLWFTVHDSDDDAARLWEAVGAAPERVLRFGDKDNFWEMGPTGPCGPCSEIHYFVGDDLAENTADKVNADSEDNLEIWNLVFMQYDRAEDGTLTDLPNPSIDTGMGLERVASVLQGVRSNFDTDLLRPLVDFVAEESGRPYDAASEDGMSMRVIADHARCAAVMITDGVFPGNEGRAYVLRKILRRALWHARRLELPTPWFARATDKAIDMLGPTYPELEQARDAVRASVTGEERLFESTLNSGIGRLDEAIARSQDGILAGEDAFLLYDTYGMRSDLIGYIAENRGVRVDWDGFETALEEQRARARRSWHDAADKPGGAEAHAELDEQLASEFVGYDHDEVAGATVLAVLAGGQRVEALESGQQGELVLDRTPFYGQAGGQVGDTGVLESDTSLARVTDAVRTRGQIVLHQVSVEEGRLAPGDRVDARIDGERRRSIRANHTATHLLHAALREVLGPHVRQAGSLVAPDRLRFDFTHFEPVTEAEQDALEQLVNREIVLDVPVGTAELALEQALETGAMALFGEKYRDPVRVVAVDDFSKELCGGTHVAATGQIGSLKIVSSESVAAGVRRIEAVTQLAALERFQRASRAVERAARRLGVDADAVPERIESLQGSLQEAERETAALRLRLATGGAGGGDAGSWADAGDGVQVLARPVEDLQAGQRRDLAESLLHKVPDGVVVLGWGGDGKAGLLVRVADHLVGRLDARELVNELAGRIGGRGGGQPRLAEAGGRDPDGLADALGSAQAVVAERLAPPSA